MSTQVVKKSSAIPIYPLEEVKGEQKLIHVDDPPKEVPPSNEEITSDDKKEGAMGELSVPSISFKPSSAFLHQVVSLFDKYEMDESECITVKGHTVLQYIIQPKHTGYLFYTVICHDTNSKLLHYVTENRVVVVDNLSDEERKIKISWLIYYY